MLLCLLAVAAAHTPPRVLLLYDADAATTDAFVAAMDALGPHTDLSATLEYNWDGTNPPATAYDAVIHLNGTTDEKFLSEEAQAALVAYVQGGGAFLHSSYNGDELESGELAGLDELTLLGHGVHRSGTLTLSPVASQVNHPLLAGLPSPLSFDAAWDAGPVRSFSTNPALTLMTDQNGDPALVVREVGLGRVVAMHNAGNDGGFSTLEDPDLQLLYRNAIWWAVRCDEDQDGDFTAQCGGADCDDSDPAVSSLQPEVCGGGDEDCDGLINESDAIDVAFWYLDGDGDGYGEANLVVSGCTQPAGYVANGEDCDDSDPQAHPGATERWYDGVNQRCDGASDYDADGDGFDSATYGGEDCDDDDPGVVPPTCGDSDDPDGDGYAAEDCDNHHSGIHPGAVEVWYDGLDQDCDGNDDDADGDGVAVDLDCDDDDPEVYPGAPDAPYDGLDADCDPEGEYDADGDGYELPPTGDDCDDEDPAVYPGATERWYDGVDQDCDGNDDDADGDGVPIGDDCDDEDPGLSVCETPKSCGCDSGASGGFAALVLSLAASARRRRSGPAAPRGG